MGLSLNGSYPVKVSAIKDLETLSRDTIKILSHAEIFSFAAYKALQSEAMDSKTLFEILKAMSRTVTNAMSIVTAQTLGLQQLRREAAIESAPKGFLTDEAKRKLRLSSFTSKLLFDGQVASICKENTDENQQFLIRNAVSIQGKPVPSSSFSTRKAKSKSGKKKSHAQKTPKKDFTFPVPRPQKKSQSFRGSNSRGRGGGPSHRQMSPLCNKRWLQNSVSRTTNSVTKPSLLPAASKSASGRRSHQSSLKGGSGGDNSGMSRTLLQNFPRSQEERETQADNRPLCAQSFCVHTDIQNGDTEKSERCHSTKRLGIFIGSDGRLFAYPDTLSVSQIPQIHVERSSVPVQGTPIRPLDKSFRVYTPYGGHCDFPKEKGDNSTSLSRRLACAKPKS